MNMYELDEFLAAAMRKLDDVRVMREQPRRFFLSFFSFLFWIWGWS